MSLVRLSTVFLLLSASAVARQTGLQTELQVIPAPPPPDGNRDYNFDVGGAVAISDEWMAVADYTVDHATGEVYMYRRTQSGWAFRQRIIGEVGSGFGGSLAIEDNTLVVGAWIWGGQLGKVCIFEWTGSTWTKTQEIIPDGLPSLDEPRFGKAVALSGDVLVVGAPEVTYAVPKGGEVRVYERIGGAWEPAARFRLPPILETLSHEYLVLGFSVAASGNTVVAGAAGNKGAVYVYERAAAGWSRTAILEDPFPDNGDNFGWSVDIDRDTLVVGRPHVIGIHARVGKAFVYERGVAGTWALMKEIRASDGYSGDYFGHSVVVEENGIAVGAPYGRFSGPATGTVYLIQRGVNGWPATEDVRMIASDSSGQSDRVGGSVDMHRGLIVAGAIGGWDEGIREGKAYAFAIELGGAYCDPADSGGILRVTGSEVAKDQHLILAVHGAPANVRGLFLFSPRPGSYPFGAETLCLGAPVSRLGYVHTGPEGVAMYDINFEAPWLDELIAGTTWYFQFAHQRQQGTGRLDLLTNAVSLTLQ